MHLRCGPVTPLASCFCWAWAECGGASACWVLLLLLLHTPRALSSAQCGAHQDACATPSAANEPQQRQRAAWASASSETGPGRRSAMAQALTAIARATTAGSSTAPRCSALYSQCMNGVDVAPVCVRLVFLRAALEKCGVCRELPQSAAAWAGARLTVERSEQWRVWRRLPLWGSGGASTKHSRAG